ncbi:MAG: hypothetical protein Q8L48_41440 [Archangium sp.]|nr:hypothetical protein [Archangium sp.]
MKPDDPELIAALASVAEGPGDEGRRRVLGDLLLERGDPRGEFLLLQFLIAENQASGPIRQRAEDLWRTHKREWMAGVDKLLCEVKLDRGFPVEARLLPKVTPAMLIASLGAPMLVTLRKLACAYDGDAIVEAIASPRLRELREVVLARRELFTATAQRGVPGRLTGLSLGFELTKEDCALLLGSPVFSKVSRLSARASSVAPRSPSRPVPPPRLRRLAGNLERLAAHPSLKRLTLTGDGFGDHRRFAELAAVWPRLPLEQLTVPGSFELTREPGGTGLTLQNMTLQELLTVRPLVPAGTVKVLLMPKRDHDTSVHEKLLKAYSGLGARMM